MTIEKIIIFFDAFIYLMKKVKMENILITLNNFI